MILEDDQVIENSIKEHLRDIERFVPQSWTLQYGQWSVFTNLIDELLWEWRDKNEDMNSMEETIRDAIKVLDCRPTENAIKKVVKELENIID